MNDEKMNILGLPRLEKRPVCDCQQGDPRVAGVDDTHVGVSFVDSGGGKCYDVWKCYACNKMLGIVQKR